MDFSSVSKSLLPPELRTAELYLSSEQPILVQRARQDIDACIQSVSPPSSKDALLLALFKFLIQKIWDSPNTISARMCQSVLTNYACANAQSFTVALDQFLGELKTYPLAGIQISATSLIASVLHTTVTFKLIHSSAPEAHLRSDSAQSSAILVIWNHYRGDPDLFSAGLERFSRETNVFDSKDAQIHLLRSIRPFLLSLFFESQNGNYALRRLQHVSLSLLTRASGFSLSATQMMYQQERLELLILLCHAMSDSILPQTLMMCPAFIHLCHLQLSQTARENRSHDYYRLLSFVFRSILWLDEWSVLSCILTDICEPLLDSGSILKDSDLILGSFIICLSRLLHSFPDSSCANLHRVIQRLFCDVIMVFVAGRSTGIGPSLHFAFQTLLYPLYRIKLIQKPSDTGILNFDKMTAAVGSMLELSSLKPASSSLPSHQMESDLRCLLIFLSNVDDDIQAPVSKNDCVLPNVFNRDVELLLALGHIQMEAPLISAAWRLDLILEAALSGYRDRLSLTHYLFSMITVGSVDGNVAHYILTVIIPSMIVGADPFTLVCISEFAHNMWSDALGLSGTTNIMPFYYTVANAAINLMCCLALNQVKFWSPLRAILSSWLHKRRATNLKLDFTELNQFEVELAVFQVIRTLAAEKTIDYGEHLISLMGTALGIRNIHPNSLVLMIESATLLSHVYEPEILWNVLLKPLSQKDDALSLASQMALCDFISIAAEHDEIKVIEACLVPSVDGVILYESCLSVFQKSMLAIIFGILNKADLDIGLQAAAFDALAKFPVPDTAEQLHFQEAYLKGAVPILTSQIDHEIACMRRPVFKGLSSDTGESVKPINTTSSVISQIRNALTSSKAAPGFIPSSLFASLCSLDLLTKPKITCLREMPFFDELNQLLNQIHNPANLIELCLLPISGWIQFWYSKLPFLIGDEAESISSTYVYYAIDGLSELWTGCRTPSSKVNLILCISGLSRSISESSQAATIDMESRRKRLISIFADAYINERNADVVGAALIARHIISGGDALSDSTARFRMSHDLAEPRSGFLSLMYGFTIASIPVQSADWPYEIRHDIIIQQFEQGNADFVTGFSFGLRSLIYSGDFEAVKDAVSNIAEKMLEFLESLLKLQDHVNFNRAKASAALYMLHAITASPLSNLNHRLNSLLESFLKEEQLQVPVWSALLRRDPQVYKKQLLDIIGRKGEVPAQFRIAAAEALLHSLHFSFFNLGETYWGSSYPGLLVQDVDDILPILASCLLDIDPLVSRAYGWVLGSMMSIQCGLASQSIGATDPANYGRLNPETSVLRFVYDRLLHGESILDGLKSLKQTQRDLPPVNWESLLKRLMAMESISANISFDSEASVRLEYLTFAATKFNTPVSGSSLTRYFIDEMKALIGYPSAKMATSWKRFLASSQGIGRLLLLGADPTQSFQIVTRSQVADLLSSLLQNHLDLTRECLVIIREFFMNAEKQSISSGLSLFKLDVGEVLFNVFFTPVSNIELDSSCCSWIIECGQFLAQLQPTGSRLLSQIFANFDTGNPESRFCWAFVGILTSKSEKCLESFAISRKLPDACRVSFFMEAIAITGESSDVLGLPGLACSLGGLPISEYLEWSILLLDVELLYRPVMKDVDRTHPYLLRVLDILRLSLSRYEPSYLKINLDADMLVQAIKRFSTPLPNLCNQLLIRLIRLLPHCSSESAFLIRRACGRLMSNPEVKREWKMIFGSI